MKVNRAAMENAAAFDRKKGGKTMPKDAVPVNSYQKQRVDHKGALNSAPGRRDKVELLPAPQKEQFFIRIGECRFGLELCRLVYDASLTGIPVDAIAETYNLTKNVVHSMIQKGRWKKLGKW